MFYVFAALGVLGKMWVGIVQRDSSQVGQHRDYRWYKSGVDVPSTTDYWNLRDLNDPNEEEACGFIKTDASRSELRDDGCTQKRGVICEW